MTILNIEPHKRVEAVLFYLESAFKEARVLASEKNTPRLLEKLELAFGLINPLLASLEILTEAQKKSLVEKMLGTQN